MLGRRIGVVRFGAGAFELRVRSFTIGMRMGSLGVPYGTLSYRFYDMGARAYRV